MALLAEFIANIILLVTRPFSLLKLAWLFSFRTLVFVIQTWIELMRATFSFHVNVICGIMTWAFPLISLPVRVMSALQRERRLEQRLNEMQSDLEYLLWDQKELQEHLQTASKECKIMEVMLADLEAEHDMAIAKIEELEGKILKLKHENLQLKEIQGKRCWSSNGQGVIDTGKNTDDVNLVSLPSWKSNYNGSGINLQQILMHKDTPGDESIIRSELLNMFKSGSKSQPVLFMPQEIDSKKLGTDEALDECHGVALSQSLFSAALSVLVGIVIWEAEDPCMPLVVALFSVVGLSLKSVVQFFSTIRNKPASDAVALLSFNFFILGTLTYPALPIVAHVSSPLVLWFLDRTMTWVGFSFL